MARSNDLRGTGARIEALLDASAAGGPVVQERAEELVRLVVDLYGAGLQRLLEIIDEANALDDVVLERLADDELVAGLLLVHGLHPFGLDERVERALVKVRPYLGSHGGDVELIGVSDAGVVRLRMMGSCDGCPSSSATLKLAVQGAIEDAAPEITGIDVEEPVAANAGAHGKSVGFVSVEALTARLRDRPVAEAANWLPLEGADALPTGTAVGRSLGGMDIVVCRVGETCYAYRDCCGLCGAGIAGAAIERRLGGGPATAVLTCPTCRGHFSVQRAGRGLDETGGHLDPLPILLRDGVVQVAVPSVVPA